MKGFICREGGDSLPQSIKFNKPHCADIQYGKIRYIAKLWLLSAEIVVSCYRVRYVFTEFIMNKHSDDVNKKPMKQRRQRQYGVAALLEEVPEERSG